MTWMLPRGYLSVSQIRTYQRCPRQYEFQYIQGLSSPISSAIHVGRSFHAAMERAFRHLLATGEVLPVEAVEQAYSEAWDENSGGVEWSEGEDPGQAKDHGVELVKHFYLQRGQALRPSLIEQEFCISVDGVPLKGVIDFVGVDGWIRDFKTGRRAPDADAAHNSIQLTAYAMAYSDLAHGSVERGVALEYVTPTKGGPKITTLESSVDSRRIDRFRGQVVGVAQAISAGLFWANEEGLACSWCPFRGPCKGGR